MCNQAAALAKGIRAQSQPQVTEGVMAAIEAPCPKVNHMEDRVGAATPPTACEAPTTTVEKGPQGVQAEEEANDNTLLKALLGRMAALERKVAQTASATVQPAAPDKTAAAMAAPLQRQVKANFL